MSFFGPGSLLSGYEPTPPGGLDPELYKALTAAFPGLQSLAGQQGQQPNTLQSLGYQWPGTQFFQGQGTGSFQSLSPFEGAKGFGSESITGGLASGTLGKSQSQQAPTGAGGLLSLPQLQLPQAVAFQQASYGGGGGGDVGMGAAGEGQGGGFGDVVGTALGGGQKLLDLFGGTSLGTQTQTPGYQAQREMERRDYSSATGTPSGLPQSLQGLDLGVLNPTLVPQQSLPSGTQFSTDVSGFGVMQPTLQPQYSLPSDTTFSLPGQGETMMAPGGSAQQALGPQSQAAPQGDLLGGGLSTLQGLYSLYGGAQTGDPGALLSGAGSTLSGLNQMAPAQVQALAQQLGVTPAMLDNLVGGLGALGAGYGLYQGIEQGDPLQALLSGASLYSSGAPVANSLLGTSLPTLSELAGQGVTALSPALASSLGMLTGGAGVGALGSIAAALGPTAAAELASAAAPSVAAALTGGSVAGVGTGVGAGVAGAGTGAGLSTLGGSLGPGIFLGPIIAGLIVKSLWGNEGIYSMEDKISRARAQQQQFSRGLGTQVGDLGQTIPLLMQLDQATPEQAADIYGQLQTIQRNFQGGEAAGPKAPGYESGLLKGGGTMLGPFVETGQRQEMQQAIAPYLQALSLGRLRAQDIMQGAGMAAPAGGWAYTPESAAKAFGSTQYYFDPESGSPIPGSFIYNQYLRGNYTPAGQRVTGYALPDQQTITPEQYASWTGAPGLLEGAQALYEPTAAAWSPAAQQALAGIQPGHIEEGLRSLFGNGPLPATNRYAQFNQLFYNPNAINEAFAASPQGQYDQQYQQALQQYQQQLAALQGQLPQLAQAAQITPTGGLDTGALAALQPAIAGGGGGMNTSSMDLEALLRQLGYIR